MIAFEFKLQKKLKLYFILNILPKDSAFSNPDIDNFIFFLGHMSGVLYETVYQIFRDGL